MRITHSVDDLGVVRLVIEFADHVDPDQAADAAWHGVNRILTSAARARGTTPSGLQDRCVSTGR